MIESLKIKDIKYLQNHIILWGKDNYSNFPWRHTDNKWHALVAEIMLQRTKAEQVLPAYLSFCSEYKSPEEYLNNNYVNVFESLGLQQREKELKSLACILMKEDIPEEKALLVRLPGVGDYISAAYCSLHLGVRSSIIDSNVVRLYGRFFGFETDGETRRKKWFIELADVLTPQKGFKEFNYGLIDFTRLICKSKPNCDRCHIKMKCYNAEKSHI